MHRPILDKYILMKKCLKILNNNNKTGVFSKAPDKGHRLETLAIYGFHA